ncbi:MAG: hypothetical protein GF353_08470 [Candidatus Lokiarchaeota archaeon]|nr:hypothetical protein [Candidatus Lokiarchaeota archaeon]
MDYDDDIELGLCPLCKKQSVRDVGYSMFFDITVLTRGVCEACGFKSDFYYIEQLIHNAFDKKTISKRDGREKLIKTEDGEELIKFLNFVIETYNPDICPETAEDWDGLDIIIDELYDAYLGSFDNAKELIDNFDRAYQVKYCFLEINDQRHFDYCLGLALKQNGYIKESFDLLKKLSFRDIKETGEINYSRLLKSEDKREINFAKYFSIWAWIKQLLKEQADSAYKLYNKTRETDYLKHAYEYCEKYEATYLMYRDSWPNLNKLEISISDSDIQIRNPKRKPGLINTYQDISVLITISQLKNKIAYELNNIDLLKANAELFKFRSDYDILSEEERYKILNYGKGDIEEIAKLLNSKLGLIQSKTKDEQVEYSIQRIESMLNEHTDLIRKFQQADVRHAYGSKNLHTFCPILRQMFENICYELVKIMNSQGLVKFESGKFICSNYHGGLQQLLNRNGQWHIRIRDISRFLSTYSHSVSDNKIDDPWWELERYLGQMIDFAKFVVHYNQ